jgi:hypothetical protein
VGTFARVSKRIVLVLMLVAGAGCAGGVGGGYSAEERSQFVDDCATSGTSDRTCRCFYDTMAEQLPYHRYQALDEALKGGATRIPDDVAALAARCAAPTQRRGNT